MEEHRAVAVSGPPTYELHTLGWRSFQDLCATVFREVMGQSFQTFADGRDAGRDGAFYGRWRDRSDSPYKGFIRSGPFVVQCKHTSSPTATLRPSAVADELAKVAKLVDAGLCDSYVLITNASITATSEARIRKALQAAGVRHSLVLGGAWLSQTIARHGELRMMVPRVYGLGDLSQIIDKRAYDQASALLRYLQSDLSTFVVTGAYQRAVTAVRRHGFVLLLGEPAAGKTVIAATLAISAADIWRCVVAKPHDATELVERWNPNEPNQFLWVDDAFGAVRHERGLIEDWSRRMPIVMAAVSAGAKVVLTSRDYVYRAARPYLKENAHPLLAEHQVVVDVAALSRSERERILYNHIKLGDQPAAFRRAIKPHLDAAADVVPFRPEGARRLGRRAFTGSLPTSRDAVTGYMANPSGFLRSVFEELDSDSQAALALVYMSGDGALGQVLTQAEQNAVARLGSTVQGVSSSIAALEGTFVRYRPPSEGHADAGWIFHHPSLREGFASFAASRPLLLDVFVAGLTDDALLTQADCGSGDARGTLVQIPPALYPTVARRLAAMDLTQWKRRYAWFRFFASRASRAFIQAYMDRDPGFFSRLTQFTSYLSVVPEPEVIARLIELDLLDEQSRLNAVARLRELAVETPDADWLHRPEWDVILRQDERDDLLALVERTLIPELDEVIRSWRDNFDRSARSTDYYDELESALRRYRDELTKPESQAALDEALLEIDDLRLDIDVEDGPPPESGRWLPPEPVGMQVGRSIFDDVDE